MVKYCDTATKITSSSLVDVYPSRDSRGVCVDFTIKPFSMVLIKIIVYK